MENCHQLFFQRRFSWKREKLKDLEQLHLQPWSRCVVINVPNAKYSVHTSKSEQAEARGVQYIGHSHERCHSAHKRRNVLVSGGLKHYQFFEDEHDPGHHRQARLRVAGNQR